MNLFKKIFFLALVLKIHCNESFESPLNNKTDNNKTFQELKNKNISNSSDIRYIVNEEQVHLNNSTLLINRITDKEIAEPNNKSLDKEKGVLIENLNKNSYHNQTNQTTNNIYSVDEIIRKIDYARILNNQTNAVQNEILKQLAGSDNITDYDDFDFKDVQNVISKDHSDNEFTEQDIKNKKEWEQEMNDFEAAEIMTFEIDGSEDEILYDIIDTPNSLVRISLFVNDERDRIDFRIYDPQGKLIYKVEDKIHIFYKLNATITGEYVYIVDNKINDIPLKVTFAIDQGHSCDLKLSKEHINSTHIMLKNIKHLIKNAKFAARFLTKKYDAHYEHVQNHNKNFFFYAMIETFVLLLIFFFQLCYIKSLINNKQ